MRSFQTELCSCFLPAAYSGNVNLAATKPWQFMPNYRDGDTVEIYFVFKISFLPKYRVIYYDYTVKWCSLINCNWCVLLDIV